MVAILNGLRVLLGLCVSDAPQWQAARKDLEQGYSGLMYQPFMSGYNRELEAPTEAKKRFSIKFWILFLLGGLLCLLSSLYMNS